jgi:hypothetical protein
MNQLPPKILVKTWIFLATKSDSDFKEARSIAMENIEQFFDTIMAAVEYSES